MQCRKDVLIVFVVVVVVFVGGSVQCRKDVLIVFVAAEG